MPDADSPGTPASSLEITEGIILPRAAGRCPAEMVDIGGSFCIDRFEASLVDAVSGRQLSPYYHPTRSQTRITFAHWQKQRLILGSSRARQMPPPTPPEWQLTEPFTIKATSRKGIVPNGYLNRHLAEQACKNAGKRLCSAEEWVTACRGHQSRKFPYGDAYRENACNVFRTTHPAMVLHDNPSTGHLDPRLNQVEENGDPLLKTAGSIATCRSEWGADAIYDMVGNLDEWVDDPEGTFLGGFYARNTREGCDARVEVHPSEYFDYSLGVRCCM